MLDKGMILAKVNEEEKPKCFRTNLAKFKSHQQILTFKKKKSLNQSKRRML
jgi:hypothetical protein